MQCTNEELVRRIQAGEKDLYLQLWAQVELWARKVAIRWERTAREGFNRWDITVDDLMSAAYIAMVDAVAGYNEHMAGRFLTYYTLRLKNAYSESYGIRTEKGQRDVFHAAVSLDAPIIQDRQSDAFCLLDMLPAKEDEDGIEACEDRIFREQLRRLLEATLEKIDSVSAEAIRLRFFDAQGLRQIAETLRISESSTYQVIQKGLRQLRQRMYPQLRELGEFNPYSGVSREAFRASGMSVQERFLLYEEQNREGKALIRQ